MKKLSKSFKPLAFAVIGAALVSCSGFTPTSIVSGDENTVTIRLNQGWVLSGMDAYGAQILAEQHCARYNKLVADEYVLDHGGNLTQPQHRTFRCLEERQTARVASPSRDAFIVLSPRDLESTSTEAVLADQTTLKIIENWFEEIKSIAPPDPS